MNGKLNKVIKIVSAKTSSKPRWKIGRILPSTLNCWKDTVLVALFSSLFQVFFLLFAVVSSSFRYRTMEVEEEEEQCNWD